MKRISKIFITLLLFSFLGGCQSNDVSSDQSFASSISESSEDANLEPSNRILPNGIFYFDVVCNYMKELSDYRNPDYITVSTERTQSDKSKLEGEKCYMILSIFDNIQLQYYSADFYSMDSDFTKTFVLGINIRAH